jgi:hypothetical protein
VVWRRDVFDAQRKGQEIGGEERWEVLVERGLLCHMRINARRAVVGRTQLYWILVKGPKATSGEAFVREG